jgi:5'(3')-deoxyribonucleotidase
MLNIEIPDGPILRNVINPPNRSLTCANIKKIVKDKCNALIKVQTIKHQQQLFKKLKEISVRREITEERKIKIVCVCMKRLQIRVGFEKKLQTKKMLFC